MLRITAYHISTDNGNCIADKTKLSASCSAGQFPLLPLPRLRNSQDQRKVLLQNCSCSDHTSWPIDQFSSILASLSCTLTELSPMIIGGDHQRMSNRMGRPLDYQKRMGSIRIYGQTERETVQTAESIIDVTFWSSGLHQGLNPNSYQRVDDGYTHSDHPAIRCRVEY